MKASVAGGTLDNDVVATLSELVYDTDRRSFVVPAYTRAALAQELDVSVPELRATLSRLRAEGRIVTRVHRPSGAELFKLPDEEHVRWQSSRSATRLG